MKTKLQQLLKLIPASIFGIGAFFFLTACGTTGKFVYPTNDASLVKITDSPAAHKKVAVAPFDDMRGDSNQAGTYFLYLIPLSPGGYGTYERPDAARMFNTIAAFEFTPAEDLAKAAAYSLRKSNLFADAFFTYGGEKDKADFLLKGRIYSTTYNGFMITYGLSIEGPLLWLFGLPAGNSHNELDLELTLTDAQTGRSVWSKRSKLETSVVQGLYYNFGHDVRGYSKLMQDIMNDSINDIHKKIRSGEITITSGSRSSESTPNDNDVATQLKNLKSLKDAGLINEEEFESKRKILMNKL